MVFVAIFPQAGLEESQHHPLDKQGSNTIQQNSNMPPPANVYVMSHYTFLTMINGE